MPWRPSDAQRHDKKAASPTAKRQWAHVADNGLARGLSEGQAIREANGVVDRRFKAHRDRVSKGHVAPVSHSEFERLGR